MNSSRETIYNGVFQALVKVVDGLEFKTCSRKTKIWTEVPANDQPAIFMQQVKETVSPGTGREPAPPNMNVLSVDVVIYANAGGRLADTVTPLLNECVDRIEALFPPPPKNPQTLSLPGVVHIRIAGDIEYREGDLGGQGIVVIPLRIVAV